MNAAQAQPLTTLIDQAAATAQRMAETAKGRPADVKVDMPMSSFSGIAAILSQLAAQAGETQGQQARQAVALARIASLEIRSAEELLELGAWKKISAELQAIAQDALGLPRKGARRAAA